ncbi:MAG: carboxypeptidase regulatory-like domain-containing protein, partial [Nitrososphaerota archaeon]
IVGRKSFDLSAANVGTVAGELQVAVGDISVAVKDITGRVLSDAIAKFEGVEQKLTIPEAILDKYKLASEEDAKTLKAVGAIFVTKLPIPTNIRYSLDLSWTSPDFGTEAKVSIVDTVDGINAKREITLPVGVVTVNVVDAQGRPVSGAEVSLGAVKAKTDAAGKAVFESVPLESEGKGIAYQVVVTREGEEVYKATEKFSTAKTSITVIGQLFDLSVLVKGAAGQGLPFATVTLKRAGVVVGHFTTDEGGAVTIPKLVAADYEVEATYKGYTGTVTVSKADLMAGKRAEITLPPYIEIAGMPLTFATFLALIIGIILLVIVIVVIAFEYVRWRGRRVGIFPPPPPKK